MENSSGVLVIIPVMNRPDAIVATLEAVHKQTLQPEHLIVVDDGSNDNTPEVVDEWLNNSSLTFSARLIVHRLNKGASEARNTGLRQAQRKYPYVYFLDSDDIPPPNFLEKAVAALEKKPAAVAVSSDRIVKDLSSNETTRYKQRKISKNPWLWFFTMGAGIGSCTVFRSKFIYKLGGYNEAISTGHDVELFMRVADLGKWLYISDCPVIFNRLASRLSDRYQDKHIIWCLGFENSVLISTAQKHISLKEYRRVLAHRWRRAGQITLEEHYHALGLAEDCFRRSLAWSLYNKAAIDLSILYLRKRLRTRLRIRLRLLLHRLYWGVRIALYKYRV